jgi:hypothetical protein
MSPISTHTNIECIAYGQGLFKAVAPNAVAALLALALEKRKRQAKLSKTGAGAEHVSDCVGAGV